MRILIMAVALLAALESPVAIAQTIGSAKSSAESSQSIMPPVLARDTRSIGNAPIGHRQPRMTDVPSVNPSDLDHIAQEDAEVDRKLNICRDC